MRWSAQLISWTAVTQQAFQLRPAGHRTIHDTARNTMPALGGLGYQMVQVTDMHYAYPEHMVPSPAYSMCCIAGPYL